MDNLRNIWVIIINNVVQLFFLIAMVVATTLIATH